MAFDLYFCIAALLLCMFLRQHSHQDIAKSLNTEGAGVGYVLQTPAVFIGLRHLIKHQVSFPVLRFRMNSTACKADEPIQQGKLKIKKGQCFWKKGKTTQQSLRKAHSHLLCVSSIALRTNHWYTFLDWENQFRLCFCQLREWKICDVSTGMDARTQEFQSW